MISNFIVKINFSDFVKITNISTEILSGPRILL